MLLLEESIAACELVLVHETGSIAHHIIERHLLYCRPCQLRMWGATEWDF